MNEKGQTKEGQTEGMIMTAQDQALRTNSLKRIICGESDETISHILSECNKLANCLHLTTDHEFGHKEFIVNETKLRCKN